MREHMTRTITFLKQAVGLCTKVGQDFLGNSYYQDRYILRSSLHSRRWVLYSPSTQSYRIPPVWHVWLRYTASQAPLLGKDIQEVTARKDFDTLETHSKKSQIYKAWTP